MNIEKENDLNLIVGYLKSLNEHMQNINASLAHSTKPAFTNQEIMELLDVSSATLKKWRDSGQLGYSQISSTYLYSKEDIDAFLKSTHYEAFASTRALKI